MAIKKFKNIEQTFDLLSPYLLSIEVKSSDLQPKCLMIFPIEWTIDQQFNMSFVVIKKTNTSITYEFTYTSPETIDDLLVKIYNIVSFNTKKIEEQRKIDDLIKKEELKLKEKLRKQQELYLKRIEKINSSSFHKLDEKELDDTLYIEPIAQEISTESIEEFNDDITYDSPAIPETVTNSVGSVDMSFLSEFRDDEE